MYIDIKNQIMALLYTSGDIDNRVNRLSRSIKEQIENTEMDIRETYGISKDKIEITEKLLDRNLKFLEMVPKIKEQDKLAISIVELEKIEDVTDEMIRVPVSELKLYSYLYMKHKNIEKVKGVLIFKSIYSNKIIEKEYEYEKSDVELFFKSSLDKYFKWVELTDKWTKDRNKSIKKLKFPFKEYRAGQEKLAKNTYLTIVHNQKMFAQAPTGVGKTISTIFPAIKAIGENKIDKIFYLTAKTVGARVAEESFELMKEQDLKFRNITLTAKDKVCLKPGANCNPVSCEYAQNYYGKVNDVIYEILKNETKFTRRIIEKYAEKYKVCPFELSLDLSLYSDGIICDYNYVFDPNVYLRRYFEENKKCNCVFLIDEAHNLVDRARNMYSAELNYKILNTSLEECSPSFPDVSNRIIDILDEIAFYEECGIDGVYSNVNKPENLINCVKSLSDSLSALFNKNKNRKIEGLDKLNELNSMCNKFINISQIYDENYIFYIENNENISIKLFCIDPSKNLRECYKRGRASIIFSATLSPIEYFRDVLGGDLDNYRMTLDSPFKEDNRKILIADNISTRYKDRDKSYDKIVEQIYSVVSARVGNYMIFLPSFDYMNKVKDKFNTKYPGVLTIKQENSMSEIEREVYLAKFDGKPKETMVSFNVISSIFSEGIDFKGELLIGAIVVGVGLPMICLERNIIKDYFQRKNGFGFDFSYTFPGLNRVVQAAGRVIRTDNDKGIILLIDDRFSTDKYNNLFPKDWKEKYTVKNSDSTLSIVEEFWKTT